MIKKRIDINIDAFPVELHRFLQCGNLYDSSCSSNAKTLYCDAGYFIKIDDKDELTQEAELGKLFHSIGMGVEVIQYISEDKDYLVTRSAVGEDLTHYLDHPENLCKVLADALRQLHSQPIGEVPVSSRLQRYLDSANGDYSGGYYDESVLMQRFHVGSKKEAWDIMQASKEKLRADTLIHGDACYLQ